MTHTDCTDILEHLDHNTSEIAKLRRHLRRLQNELRKQTYKDQQTVTHDEYLDILRRLNDQAADLNKLRRKVDPLLSQTDERIHREISELRADIDIDYALLADRVNKLETPQPPEPPSTA
jgi:polyhydroxyalkanoate synthesis regulator phasin